MENIVNEPISFHANMGDIKVGDRMRKDLGDLDSLAASLQTFGQIQPIVINYQNELVAGGRRFAAAQLLGWEKIQVCIKETLSKDHLREIELEENVRRKEMTWQERVFTIEEIHNLRRTRGAINGDLWLIEQTGELLGMGRTNIHYALSVAEHIRKGTPGVNQCTSLNDALRLLIALKQDEAQAALVASSTLKFQSPIQEMNSTLLNDEGRSGLIEEPKHDTSYSHDDNGDVIVPLTQMIFNCHWRDWAKGKSEAVDHIITDPPYAIDMDNLSQENTGMKDIDKVVNEHQVEDNIAMLREFVPTAFRILKPGGFCVLWCDIMQWEFLHGLGLMSNFLVQRWPLIWCKTHTCLNQAAQFNTTKNYEIAIVLRKPGAQIISPQASSYIVADGLLDRALYGGHPFVKPYNVWKWLLEAFTLKGQTIWDPFAGRGSFPRTAINCGYNFIANEINTDHFNYLAENIQTIYKIMLRGKVKFV